MMKRINEISGIKAWAEDDRPREKMIRKGRQALSDAELLAILLGSGTRSLTAVDLAKQVLMSRQNKLNELGRLGIEDFKKFPGIGEAKAITIMAALELGRRRRVEERNKKVKISSSQDIFHLMSPKFVDLDHEEFHILLLSRSHKVKDQICISRGGISGTVVDQRLIFKPALEKLASAVVLCHNHPSGTLRPSEQDKILTQKLVKSGAMLDIPILDHLIFTDEGYFSFADEGIL
ncbi:MAG: DNA repair protein RadC [Bacteroidota bacterium]